MAVIIAFSRILLIAGLAALATAASGATWQPSQPVRLIVPVQGGTVDLLARLVAPHLQQAFEHPVIVEPRPGAGGDLGTNLVAKAAPDGTTILVAFTAPITVNATLMGNLRYDPLKDLLPITLAVSTPQFLTINPAVPARSVSEFVAYATAHPGQLNYASVSIGSASHLTMEMLKATAGIDMLHVPYKGAGPAVTELLADRVQAAMLVPGNIMPYLPTGKLRVLATTGRRRFSGAPEIPTLIESGYPDFEAIAWIGFMAPGGTPQPIIDRYHEEIVKTLALPEVRQRLTSIYFDVVASTPEQFRDYIRWETPRWAKVIHDTGAKPD
jgi:tripartite-type tricarboxylate transporter receptor subunit TctC